LHGGTKTFGDEHDMEVLSMCCEEMSVINNAGHVPMLPPPILLLAHSGDGKQIPDPATIILDRTACVISWDAAAELLFGYPAIAAVGKPFYHFLELESLTPGNVEWELQTAYYRGTSICNRHYTHHDGFPFRATAEIVPLWDGEFLGYKVTFSDTQRING
jgi:PAS domain-containing protein